MLAETLIYDLRGSGVEVDVRVPDAGRATAPITDVEHDSRHIRPGSLFCAVPGETADGHDYVPSAVRGGAQAVLVERFCEVPVLQLCTPNVRVAMPHAAAAVHGHPSRSLDVVGITGTNGKTTTTHLLASVLRLAGSVVEIIGTLSGIHTTPEATELQRRLRGWADQGVEVVAAEISSHALDQHRADAVSFAVAAFSNLTPDHLDYHRDMQSYFEAKCALFDGRARRELVNVDDPWGARLASERFDAVRLSLNSVAIEQADMHGTRFRWRDQLIELGLPGEMNVSNALIAAEAALVLGLGRETIAAGLTSAPQVRGRMEHVPNPFDDRVVVVDYSHTPDSIARALATLRSAGESRQITIVFGCGGDRDRAKRPQMARAAEAADRVIITSDNPRSEDPQSIVDDAVAGLARPDAAIREIDRRNAIEIALRSALPDGVVLIAGKGHETTQTIGDQEFPFDDVAIAATLLAETAK